MNAKRTMYKLQRALCAQGRIIKINQRQGWNADKGMMYTKYVVQEDGAGTICETYKPIEVVQLLAALLNGGDAQ